MAEHGNEWQPIESCPRDGSWFLICHYGDVTLARYKAGEEYPWQFVDNERGEFSPNAYLPHSPPKLWKPLPEPSNE